jgi:hypothetical protein
MYLPRAELLDFGFAAFAREEERAAVEREAGSAARDAV